MSSNLTMREINAQVEKRLPARVVAAMMLGLPFGNLPRIKAPRNRMRPCTNSSCGKLTRGGGKCFTCETKAAARVAVLIWAALAGFVLGGCAPRAPSPPTYFPTKHCKCGVCRCGLDGGTACICTEERPTKPGVRQ